MNENELLAEMSQAVVQGDRDIAERLARQGLLAGMSVNLMLDKGLIPGIRLAGDMWECGEYFLPELMMSVRAMQTATGVLQPALEAQKVERHALGRAAIGTIQGDIHDIGKSLVAGMLSAAGFEVRDLGADVAIERFTQEANDFRADLVCCSALLTTTMTNIHKLIRRLTDDGVRGRFKVLVGGAPITQQWADEIGADGYGDNAVAAVAVAKKLMEGSA